MAKLTDLDKDYIRKHCHEKSDKDLGELFGCSPRTIERFRKSEGLLKRGGKLNPREPKKELSILTEPKIYDMQEAEIAEFHRKELLNSVRGKRVRKILSDNHWAIFVEEWVAYHVQLEELTHTEKGSIEQLLILKIRMFQNQERVFDLTKKREKLIQEHGEAISFINLEDTDDEDEMMPVIMEFKNIDGGIQTYNSEYKDLLDKAEKIDKSLNTTRQQREAKGKVGGDTFFSKLKEFENLRKRKKEGRVAEMLKVATEKNKNNLRKQVEYMDGEIGPQLLDAETVRLTEEQKEKE